MSAVPIPVSSAIDSFRAGLKPPSLENVPRDDVQKAARDFESFFLSQMLESMFAGVPTDGMFGGGPAEGIYRSLMLQQYGRMISEAGGVGIADSVFREILTLQEIQ